MKVKHLVSVLFISLVVILLVSGFVTSNKQKSALNTIKTSYSYASTDLPQGVNVYKLKIEDKCNGKTCGCGNLPACVDPCKGKTCGCGNLPACKTINKGTSNGGVTMYEPTKKKNSSITATGKLVHRPRGPVGYYLFNFEVKGTTTPSDYTLLLTIEPAKKLTTFDPSAKPSKSYCWGADNRFFPTNNSITNNRTACTLLILKPNKSRSLAPPLNQKWKYCHLVKGTKVVSQMPISQCKAGFNLP